MNILVQKFGGTSVSTKERRLMVVSKVRKAIEAGYAPVVVVSAMGRKGEPYATDTLLSLVSEEFKKNNPLGIDLLMSCGEIISTVVTSDEFIRQGLEAIPLTGGQSGIITNNRYNNAEILRVDAEKIISILKEGKIPIVAGFQGISEDGFLTTIGRGGSDVTASILGAALKAVQVEIFTDVDGIMTADPRIVEDAALINEISYNEVFQFAEQGAKVIHPRAVEIAMKSSIPLVIKNTMNDCEGTIINSQGDPKETGIIAGITHMKDRLQVTLCLEENISNNNFYEVFAKLAESDISIDLINVFPNKSIFTIDGNDIYKLEEVMDRLELKYSTIENCSKIAIIGSRMRGIPGVMAKILKVLFNEKVQVLQTADSHTTIWCLVNGKDTLRAINTLHKEFGLGVSY